MNQLLSIIEDKIVIDKVRLNKTEGTINHFGNLNVLGTVTFTKDLTVDGILTVDTLNVKNLAVDNNSTSNPGRWIVNTEKELEGNGLHWAWGTGSVNFMYREGRRLYANADFDLEPGFKYKIGNAEILSANELGPQVIKSKLREVGSLKDLTVQGNTLLSSFAFFNSINGRLGLNTDEPNGALSIVENDVEIVVGSPAYGKAKLGTFTNHSFSLITDNTERIVIKNNGDIIIGDENSKNGNLVINGTLRVDTLVADTRIDRYSPLEFKSSKDSSIYGKGLLWTGNGVPRQFVLKPNPDRLWASESIDIAEGQMYYINGRPVISNYGLGEQITRSNLSTLGTLESLAVSGSANFTSNVAITSGVTSLKTAVFADDVGNDLVINSNSISSSNNISIKIGDHETYYADDAEIIIGNKSKSRRPVKLFGPVSIGISTPDTDVDLTVKGNIQFADKKFITSISAPVEGNFNKGDICWNQNPAPDNYIGWVCVLDGSPGEWLPFGAISR